MTSAEIVTALGKGPGIVGAAYFATGLGFVLGLTAPEALGGFAMVVGAGVGFVTIGGAAKAIGEARNGNGQALPK